MMEEYKEKNAALVYEQRMGVLKKGITFPRRMEKVYLLNVNLLRNYNNNHYKLQKATLSIKNNSIPTQYLHVQLCENLKSFKVYSCDDANTKKANYDQIYPVSTIRHVITGKNCPHFKEHK